MIDNAESKRSERNARRDRKVDSGIDAQKTVLEHDGHYWQAVATFAAQRKLLNQQNAEALKFAVRIPKALPSASQSVKLLELLERALSEGYKE